MNGRALCTVKFYVVFVVVIECYVAMLSYNFYAEHALNFSYETLK